VGPATSSRVRREKAALAAWPRSGILSTQLQLAKPAGYGRSRYAAGSAMRIRLAGIVILALTLGCAQPIAGAPKEIRIPGTSYLVASIPGFDDGLWYRCRRTVCPEVSFREHERDDGGRSMFPEFAVRLVENEEDFRRSLRRSSTDLAEPKRIGISGIPAEIFDQTFEMTFESDDGGFSTPLRSRHILLRFPDAIFECSLTAYGDEFDEFARLLDALCGSIRGAEPHPPPAA